jgi:hypothetical protein
VASFAIPSNSPPSISWTLNVWKKGALVGSDTGTSGVLTVTVPRSIHGTLQADVRRNGRWYSGTRVALPGQGGTGTGTGGGSGNHGHGSGNHGHGDGHHGHGGGNHGAGKPPGGGSGTVGPPSGSSNGGSNSNGGSSGTPPTIAVTATGAPANALHDIAGIGFAGSTTTGGHAAHSPVTLAAGSDAPSSATATDLAFTGSGTGNGFWSTFLGGAGLFLLGGFLLMRRRATKVPQS